MNKNNPQVRYPDHDTKLINLNLTDLERISIMIKPDYIFNKPNGDTISCYGECIPSNNFDIVCDDWDNDGVWCGDDHHEITTWKRLCQYLHDNYSDDIVQIEAI